jgi:endoglucanase
MLLSVAIDDRERFARAWQWTRANLQRPDRLLASRWADGRVVDSDPATDADLDAAHALLLAGSRFDEPQYRRQALRLADGVLAKETTRADRDPVLVAGPWAQGRPATVNPSYFDPQAFAALERASGDERWSAIDRSSERILAELTETPPALPPDWASLEAGGAAPSANQTSGAAPTYGFDAARVAIRMAGACDAEGRRLAARPWPFLEDEASGELSSEYTLDGQPAGSGEHPVALVGAAAAADAAGDVEARDELLDRAAAADEEAPTYYGAAWVALGGLMLSTDWPGDCRPDTSGSRQ